MTRVRIAREFAPEFVRQPRARDRVRTSALSCTVVPVTVRVTNPISTTIDAVVPGICITRGMANLHDERLNLATHRAPLSVWNRRGWDGSREGLAVSRWLVGVGGGALLVQGLRRRSALGSLIAGIGGSLAWWALTGEGDLPDVRGMLARLFEPWRHQDLVHEASADSFPASDAPAWTPTLGTGVSARRER